MELVNKLREKYKQFGNKAAEFLDNTSEAIDEAGILLAGLPDDYKAYDKLRMFGKDSDTDRFKIYKAFKKHPEILNKYVDAVKSHESEHSWEPHESAWKAMHEAIVAADLLKDDDDAVRIRNTLKNSPYNSEQTYILTHRR